MPSFELHDHLRTRLQQRGVTIDEVERTLADGWPSAGAREGRLARTLVFPFAAEWQGRVFAEKEVTVYFKVADGETVVFTAIARYGAGFPRGGVT